MATRDSSTTPDPRFLWEEYKLLQDKLDKIGAFRFQVKGWLVTLITGFIVSGYVSRMPWFGFLLACPLIHAFMLLEMNQDAWRSAFTRRIKVLERLLAQFPAHHVFSGHRTHIPPAKKSDPDKIQPTSPGNAVYLVTLGLQRRSFWNGAMVLHADRVIYVMLYLMVFTVATFVGVGASGKKQPQQIEISEPFRVEMQIPSKLTSDESKPDIPKVQ